MVRKGEELGVPLRCQNFTLECKFYHVLFLTSNIHSAALVVCGIQYFLGNMFHAPALLSHSGKGFSCPLCDRLFTQSITTSVKFRCFLCDHIWYAMFWVAQKPPMKHPWGGTVAMEKLLHPSLSIKLVMVVS